MGSPRPVNEKLASFSKDIGTLPSLPSLYMQLTEELRSPDVSLTRVSQIISKDLAMTSKILQIINSAYFGISRQVSSVERAVLLLGLEMVRTFVLSAEVFSMFEPKKLAGLTVAGLWRHSINCSSIARRLAVQQGMPRQSSEHVWTASFLHDVGKLLMAVERPEQYREVTKLEEAELIPSFVAERAVFGFDHAEVGGFLLGKWKLPLPVVEAVGFHHDPMAAGDNPTLSPLTVIHVSDYLEHEVSEPDRPYCRHLEKEYLQSVRPVPDLEAWRRAAEDPL